MFASPRIPSEGAWASMRESFHYEGYLLVATPQFSVSPREGENSGKCRKLERESGVHRNGGP